MSSADVAVLQPLRAFKPEPVSRQQAHHRHFRCVLRVEMDLTWQVTAWATLDVPNAIARFNAAVKQGDAVAVSIAQIVRGNPNRLRADAPRPFSTYALA